MKISCLSFLRTFSRNPVLCLLRPTESIGGEFPLKVVLAGDKRGTCVNDRFEVFSHEKMESDP